MYRKLLKHDWRSTRGVLVLMCLTSLGAALLGGFSIRNMILLDGAEDFESLLAFLNGWILMSSFLAISICSAGSLFFLIWRFYKSRFADEGYLTFTLPVTTHQVLLSSLTNTVLSMLVMLAATFASLCILGGLGVTAIPHFYKDLIRELPALWHSLLWLLEEKTGTFLMLLAYVPATALGEIIVMMLSVTIGSILARKHKVLAAIGVYYGINMVLSILISTCTFSGIMFADETSTLISTTFVVPTLLMSAVGIGGYFLMHHLVQRKLNLP